MLPGYNHNVQYKGKLFHIQTEDSGLQNPHIITLLYEGGNILSRKKTSYEDILKSDKLTQVVKEMMQEQHKAMLRDLKNGILDSRIFGAAPAAEAEIIPIPTPVTPVPKPAAPPSKPAVAPPPPSAPIRQPSAPAAPPSRPSAPPPQAKAAPPPPKPPPSPPKEAKLIELKEGVELKDEDIFGSDLISDKSLDEVILGYLAQNLEEE